MRCGKQVRPVRFALPAPAAAAARLRLPHSSADHRRRAGPRLCRAPESRRVRLTRQIWRRKRHRHGCRPTIRCSLATLFTFSNASSKAHIRAHQRFWNAGSSELHATYSALPTRACRRSVPPRPRSGAGAGPARGRGRHHLRYAHERRSGCARSPRRQLRAWLTRIPMSRQIGFGDLARHRQGRQARPQARGRRAARPRRQGRRLCAARGATAEAQRLQGQGHLHATWRQPAFFPVESAWAGSTSWPSAGCCL